MNYLNILPDFTNNWDLAVAVFIMPIAVQWWAVWYPGAEPGGGSYIAQRMLASKSEKDSLGAVLFFNIAHYVLRPWPWILVGLWLRSSSTRSSPTSRRRFRISIRSLLGHDIAYPAMLKFLPAGFIGLMVGGLIAANSSTILTHLNWGASYLVHDFYRRFITQRRDEQHYVLAGRLATVRLFVCSSAHRLPARHREGCLRHHPADWRRHRAAVSRPLVLVARQRVVRGRRDGQLVRHVRRRCWSSPSNGVAFSTHAALLITIAVTTVLLGGDGVRRARDRSRTC